MGSVTHQTGKEPIDEIISIENEETSHFFEYKMIGRSVNKRQINVVYIGERVNPKLKIFIMAGQHGDEIYCRKATERYDRYSAKLVKVFCALKNSLLLGVAKTCYDYWSNSGLCTQI